ncbi:hypothetical protein TNCV_1001091 [Trichonephila clavipes]|nr:hypothetical protein TNCV_1001091 [Trichonephila clavipes]
MVWPFIVIHKCEALSNSASEQTHTGKNRLLTIETSGYRTSVENAELSPATQHNTSRAGNSRNTVTVSFHGVTGMKHHVPTSVQINF